MSFDATIIAKPFGPKPFTYDWRRPALHALACGAGTDDLDLVLESRGPNSDGKALTEVGVGARFDWLWGLSTALEATVGSAPSIEDAALGRMSRTSRYAVARGRKRNNDSIPIPIKTSSAIG